jgi:hypothetical protein
MYPYFTALQVFEVAPSLHMVELRKTGGDTLEFHNVRFQKEALFSNMHFLSDYK